MKVKVSDYIVNRIRDIGCDTVFSLTGGFAMHLNDSFGKNDAFKVYYHHHEQACSYAAVGYTKLLTKPSVVCATAGVAATNCISPCLIAYQDSVSVIFITGQVKSLDAIRTINSRSEVKLRNYAFSDCDIISAVTDITKYSYEITSVSEVQSVVHDALTALTTGRPGPVWLSIPVDVQGLFIEDTPLTIISTPPIWADISKVYSMLSSAERPVVIAGNGISLAGCRESFLDFIHAHQLPVVTSFLGIDLIETASPYFVGRVGIYGDRAGNFAVQNSDLLIVLGCRMAQGVVGYNPNTFARAAKVVYVDIDNDELSKDNIRCSLAIHMDLTTFFKEFRMQPVVRSEWVAKCAHWKAKWMFEMPVDVLKTEVINPYYALKALFGKAPENKNVISSSGSIDTLVHHMLNIKHNDRYIWSGQGDMGFDTPATIGCQIATPSKTTMLIVGEGAFQLNIQELQTIVHNKLPLKIVVFNNSAYGAIEITQTAYFKNKFGVDSSSGLSFPDTGKIAAAYGIQYMSVRYRGELDKGITTLFACEGPVILEIFCCIQARTPKLSARKNEDGTFTSLPFEDMEPFLPREEFNSEMIIPPI